jgi:hypothetical protein
MFSLHDAVKFAGTGTEIQMPFKFLVIIRLFWVWDRTLLASGTVYQSSACLISNSRPLNNFKGTLDQKISQCICFELQQHQTICRYCIPAKTVLVYLQGRWYLALGKIHTSNGPRIAAVHIYIMVNACYTCCYMRSIYIPTNEYRCLWGRWMSSWNRLDLN